MTRRIIIDLQIIKEISLKGIWRTAAFMGLGVNAARSTDLKDYQLVNETSFHILPDGADDVQIEHLKENFEQWIVCCGLRELIETFSVFLNAVYKACLLASFNNKPLESDKFGKSLESFDWKGVEKKLKILRSNFGIETTKEIYFKSINQVRNCLTHRNGIVGQKDLGGDDSLKLCWLSLDSIIKTPSGEVISLNPPFPKSGTFLKEGGELCIKVIEKIKEFSFGDVIKLNPNDLSEICLVFFIATEEISKSTFDHLKKIGIEIKVTE
jgi:hypothetical protein